MPIVLPPDAPFQSVPGASASSPLAADLTGPLKAAYTQTQDAWGGRWTAATVHVKGQALPRGLQALLDRHNPELTRALVRSGHRLGGRFVADPAQDPAQTARRLAQADGQVLDQLVDLGLLSARPQNTVDAGASRHEGSRTEQDFQEMEGSLIHMMASPQGDFSSLTGLNRGVDPVAFRWMTLMHEAAHAELAATRHNPFEMPGWTGEQNQAMNHLVFGNPFSRSRQVFEESFADVYGALMALRVTNEAPAMRQAIGAMQDIRVQMTAQRLVRIMKEGNTHAAYARHFDSHTASTALEHLMHDVATGRLAVADLSPERLKRTAQHYASRSVVEYLNGPEGRAVDDLAWAERRSSDPGHPHADDRFLMKVETPRVGDYLTSRLDAYAQAGSLDEIGPALTSGDPVLDAVAERDAQFAAAFWALSPSDRDAVGRTMDEGKVPASASPAVGELLDRMSEAVRAALADPQVHDALGARMAADARVVREALASSSPFLGVHAAVQSTARTVALPGSLGQRAVQVGLTPAVAIGARVAGEASVSLGWNGPGSRHH